jgi:WXG100 family type VII secretion target
MSKILVSSEEVNGVSGNLSTGAGDIESQLKQMESQVKGLIDANWTGMASDSFRTLWDKWHVGAAQLNEALTGISKMLAATAKTYQETEDALASQMRG